MDLIMALEITSWDYADFKLREYRHKYVKQNNRLRRFDDIINNEISLHKWKIDKGIEMLKETAEVEYENQIYDLVQVIFKKYKVCKDIQHIINEYLQED